MTKRWVVACTSTEVIANCVAQMGALNTTEPLSDGYTVQVQSALTVPSQSFYLINVLSNAFRGGNMIVVNQYTWAMFFFHIIQEVIMYENNCAKSIYMSDVFLLYYWKGDNVWKLLR